VETLSNSFTLTRKTDVNSGAVSLAKIDDEMCRAFDIVPDDDKYYHGWVDTIGLLLACGKSLDQIISRYKENISSYPENMPSYMKTLKIAEYLKENYIPELGRNRQKTEE
jgi:hypothetical protein